jgi:alcohol/geraniol dehydrogenase (NADP+)
MIMSSLTQTRDKPVSALIRELSPASKSYKAWVAKAAKQPMVFEALDPGPLGDEEVEVAVEHCGLCHSDLSVSNNEWGISQFPAVLGHEVVGRITALGPNTKSF